jgi:hypothetical protein
VSITPTVWPSPTAPLPWVVVDAIFGAEELIGLPTHLGMVDVWQAPVPFHEFVRAQAALARKRSKFRYLDTVAGDVEGLAGRDLIHDGSGVIAELSLSDDLHHHLA